MDHLLVQFSSGLPSTIRAINKKGLFRIPKKKRLLVLKHIQEHPEYVVVKRRRTWEVLGTAPPMTQKGGNSYNAFLKNAKKVLSNVPGNPLENVSLLELQKDAQIKRLYEDVFKHNQDLIGYDSVRNAIASTILNYDGSSGQIRDSRSDARRKRADAGTVTAASSASSWGLSRPHEFDLWTLQLMDNLLKEKDIPEEFLQSPYFTNRTSLLRLYEQDREHYRSIVERHIEQLESETAHDYKVLVNRVSQQYLARYPFRVMAETFKDKFNFVNLGPKVASLEMLSSVVSSAYDKFPTLDALRQAYAASDEAKYVNVNDFMKPIQSSLTSDEGFTYQLFKANTRTRKKVQEILGGKTIP